MPELVLKLGDSVLQNYVFDKDIMSVGRSRDNDVVIENLSVSRNHARIRRQGGKYILTDLNSANGTFVNGVRVSKTEIVDQDVIAIGKHKMHFQNKVVEEEALIVDAFGADRTVMVERSAPSGMIVVTDGKLKGQQFALTRPETTVGKAANNDVVLSDDWFLGKRQAVIVRLGENDYELNDLGNFRKTKVNGEPISGPKRLKAGDSVEFGNTRCVFQFTGDNYAEQAGGRVPQELALEDSIFSTGASDLQVVEYVQHPQNGQEAHHLDLDMEEIEPVAAQQNPNETPIGFEPEQQAMPVAVEMEAAVHEELDIEPEHVAGIDIHAQDDASEAEEDAHGEHEPEVAAVGAGSSEKRGKRKRKRKGSGGDLDAGFTTERFSAVRSEDEAGAGAGADAPPSGAMPAWHDGFDSDKIVSIPLLEEARIQREDDERQAAAAAATTAEPAAGKGEKPEAVSEIASPKPPTNQPAEVLLDPDQLAKEIALWEAALANKSAVIRKQASKNLKKLTGKDYAY